MDPSDVTPTPSFPTLHAYPRGRSREAVMQVPGMERHEVGVENATKS